MNALPHHVWFAHGQEGLPWGRKIKVLAATARERGFHVESPDYRGIASPDARVARLLDLNPNPPGRLVLVGSSMGAYLSLAASSRLKPDGLFLLAPALGLPGYAVTDPAPHARSAALVHGWRDDVVPLENVIHFAARHRLALHLVDDGHRLLEALGEIESLFARFLERILTGEEPP